MTQPQPDWNWNERYATGDTPWDSGRPSDELKRILREGWVRSCRTLELGCGTGSNAVFLAQQGFEVTAVDTVAQAIEQAKAKAAQAGVDIQFLQSDAFGLPDLGPAFAFVFDRGLYHILRNNDLERFVEALRRVTEPGSVYLTLTGNASLNLFDSAARPRVFVGLGKDDDPGISLFGDEGQAFWQAPE